MTLVADHSICNVVSKVQVIITGTVISTRIIGEYCDVSIDIGAPRTAIDG